MLYRRRLCFLSITLVRGAVGNGRRDDGSIVFAYNTRRSFGGLLIVAVLES